MAKQDLLDYFKDYKVVSAKQSYGPLGHCGMSVLLFESSPLGYQDSEKLHKHFLELRRGRSAWENNGKELTARNLQLYGFLANKSDLDEFNKYCQGLLSTLFQPEVLFLNCESMLLNGVSLLGQWWRIVSCSWSTWNKITPVTLCNPCFATYFKLTTTLHPFI